MDEDVGTCYAEKHFGICLRVEEHYPLLIADVGGGSKPPPYKLVQISLLANRREEVADRGASRAPTPTVKR